MKKAKYETQVKIEKEREPLKGFVKKQKGDKKYKEKSYPRKRKKLFKK